MVSAREHTESSLSSRLLPWWNCRAHWCPRSWQDGFPSPGNLAGSVSSVLLSLQHPSLWGCNLHVSLSAFIWGCVYCSADSLLAWLLLLVEHYRTLWDVQCYWGAFHYLFPQSIRCHKIPVTLSQPMLWWCLNPDSTVEVELCFRITQL